MDYFYSLTLLAFMTVNFTVVLSLYQLVSMRISLKLLTFM